uniref:Ubiquitin carboxyl-terminal hydrolase n=1 Tax=Cyanistes caeruleus TaxID=156563 RepID=A0A8C0U1D0_CYACU
MMFVYLVSDFFWGKKEKTAWKCFGFLKQLGIHPDWQFVDVYGMEPELLSMVPRPVCAVLLLFPITEKYETFRTEEEERIKAKGQDVKSSVYFMKQTINNACGTIGLIHAIANNRDKMNFETNSSLKKFLEDSLSMTPEERAKYLETYEAIRVTHESSAHEGQTEAPSIDEKVDLHFIALVNVGGHLYELGLRFFSAASEGSVDFFQRTLQPTSCWGRFFLVVFLCFALGVFGFLWFGFLLFSFPQLHHIKIKWYRILDYFQIYMGIYKDRKQEKVINTQNFTGHLLYLYS